MAEPDKHSRQEDERELSSRRRRPPSYPTRRSRRIRDAIFVLSAVASAGALIAIRRESVAQVAGTADTVLEGVFADTFEPYLRFRFRLEALGMKLTGRAERTSEAPFEGRMIVTHRGRARAKISGQKVEFEFDWPTRWDVKSGFVMTRLSARASVPGLLEQDMDFTATREGRFLVFRIDVPGADVPKMKPIAFPEGAGLSSGFMERAPVDQVTLGAKWNEQSVDFGGELSLNEVEVVSPGLFEIEGQKLPAFRAIARMESATGRLVEYERWYDPAGRCLRQTMPLGVLTIVVEREDIPHDAAGETGTSSGPAIPE